MRKAKIKIDDLINEGNTFSFENNKRLSKYGNYYTDASPEFLTWVSKVENYISENFDENSGPYKLINTVEKVKFKDYDKSDFETELNKLKGAIISCKSLNPNKKNKDNQIISLIKNPIFWTILVVVISSTYKLGYDNGIAKFDNEKIEMNKQITIYKDSIILLNDKIKQLNDTIINRQE